MTPHRGYIVLFRSSKLFPRLRLGPLKAFRADTAPFKGPRLALCVAYRNTEKQGHRQNHLIQTLIVHLLKTHFLTAILHCEKLRKWN